MCVHYHSFQNNFLFPLCWTCLIFSIIFENILTFISSNIFLPHCVSPHFLVLQLVIFSWFIKWQYSSSLHFIINEFQFIDAFNWHFSVAHILLEKKNAVSTDGEIPGKFREILLCGAYYLCFYVWKCLNISVQIFSSSLSSLFHCHCHS